MRILLIDNGSSLLPKLQQLIPGHEITVKSSEVRASEARDFDLVVLSGGPHDMNESGFEEESRIIKSGKPVIGICFGCELIAQTFGGTVSELADEQKGIYEIEILSDKLGGPKKIKVYEGHRQFIPKMPDNFEVLAKSNKGPEIIKHTTLPIYGLQFHPENMIEETDGDELFLNLLNQF